jgi:putative redox protein
VRRHLAGSEEEIRERGQADVLLGGRRVTIGREFLDSLEELRMREVIAGLGRPLAIFHSPVDRIVGIENAAHIFEAARHPKSFISLDRADHFLLDPRDAGYVGAVLAAWAGRYLDPPPPPAVEELPEAGVVVARTERGGYRTEVSAEAHTLLVDEPVALGGTDTGPTPYGLLAAALGACTSITLQMYAARKGWPLEEAIVRLRHRKVHALDDQACPDRPVRLDEIEREIRLEGKLTPEQRARLREIADRCPVHRTFEAGIHVRTVLVGEPAMGAAPQTDYG